MIDAVMVDLEIDIFVSCAELARDLNEELMEISEMLDVALFDIYLEYVE